MKKLLLESPTSSLEVGAQERASLCAKPGGSRPRGRSLLGDSHVSDPLLSSQGDPSVLTRGSLLRFLFLLSGDGSSARVKWETPVRKAQEEDFLVNVTSVIHLYLLNPYNASVLPKTLWRFWSL